MSCRERSQSHEKSGLLFGVRTGSVILSSNALDTDGLAARVVDRRARERGRGRGRSDRRGWKRLISTLAELAYLSLSRRIPVLLFSFALSLPFSIIFSPNSLPLLSFRCHVLFRFLFPCSIDSSFPFSTRLSSYVRFPSLPRRYLSFRTLPVSLPSFLHADSLSLIHSCNVPAG